MVCSIWCVVCGKTLDKCSRKSVCSAECEVIRKKEYQSKYKAKNDKFVMCKVCGKPFHQKYKREFCSDECKDKNKKERSMSKCKICGSKIYGDLKKNYCSDECRKQSKIKISNCKVCGSEYIKDTPSVCCSDKCREINSKNIVSDNNRKTLERLNRNIKCKVCDSEFIGRGNVSFCSDKCRVINKRQKEQIKSRRKELKRQLKRIVSKKCPVCGETFKGNGNKYFCSEDCRTLHRKRQKSLSRVSKRFAGREIDKTVTLDSLIKRDNNICYICGSPCDSNDFDIINGYTVCGNMYPSIDHVIPASKGGTHTWDNVKLAHRICNSHKCDSLYKENKEGQMEMFV